MTPAPATPAAVTTPGPLPAAFPDALAEQLRARIRRAAPAEVPTDVGVMIIDLASGARLGIGEKTVMHAASTMKVPVLIELFRQASAGRFALDSPVVVYNEFTSIADGSRYTLSADDDGEQALYGLVGRTTTYRDLARRMIVRSSNLGTNILIDRVGADSVAATMHRIGADGMRVLRGVEDGPAFRAGMNNTATAEALALSLEAIARCADDGRIPLAPAAIPDLGLDPEECRDMVEILAAQEFNDMIPAGLPAGVRVAHKTGSITHIRHDGGIVYPPGRAPYIIAVLTRGFDDENAAALVADLSRLTWDAITGTPPITTPADPTARELLSIHAHHRIPTLAGRRFDHATLWSTIAPIIDAAPALQREEIGRSVHGRPIHLVRYGTGPTGVLLWSQMHGDESTATMALADLFAFLAAEPDAPLARRLAEKLTVLAIPMLNPDGAERFERRNAQGIDINRDARALATPEARILKGAQERFRPAFGFNLHDQNVRTRVGNGAAGAAIALLAPAPNGEGIETEAHRKATHLAAAIRRAIEPIVGGHITRYDDEFNPRAFGDLMQSWDVATVLIESGGWAGDPEKQVLRAVNFVAILAALDAIATGAFADADPRDYLTLPENGRAVNDLVVRGGTVVAPGLPPLRADVAIDFDDPLHRTGPRLADIGDLPALAARDTIDATGLFVHPDPAAVRPGPDGLPHLEPGAPFPFTMRRSADPLSEVVLSRNGQNDD